MSDDKVGHAVLEPPTGGGDDDSQLTALPAGSELVLLNLDIVTDVLLSEEDLKDKDKINQRFQERAKEILSTLLFNLPMSQVVYNPQKKMYTMVGITNPVQGMPS